jgi:hypothetical protein
VVAWACMAGRTLWAYAPRTGEVRGRIGRGGEDGQQKGNRRQVWSPHDSERVEELELQVELLTCHLSTSRVPWHGPSLFHASPHFSATSCLDVWRWCQLSCRVVGKHLLMSLYPFAEIARQGCNWIDEECLQHVKVAPSWLITHTLNT